MHTQLAFLSNNDMPSYLQRVEGIRHGTSRLLVEFIWPIQAHPATGCQCRCLCDSYQVNP
jgi:hypothetical protein